VLAGDGDGSGRPAPGDDGAVVVARTGATAPTTVTGDRWRCSPHLSAMQLNLNIDSS